MVANDIISNKFSNRAAVLNAHTPILVLFDIVLFQRYQRHFARKNASVIVRNLILRQCRTTAISSDSVLFVVFDHVVFDQKFCLNIRCIDATGIVRDNAVADRTLIVEVD